MRISNVEWVIGIKLIKLVGWFRFELGKLLMFPSNITADFLLIGEKKIY